MKKIIRIAALFLALLMLALPLVGCDRIDEMRANQGFWNDDGSISFNGETYKLLSPSKYIHIRWYQTRLLQITAKGVPVLLSEEYGITCSISYDEIFIKQGLAYYCRADKYDYVEECIKHHGNMDYLGFYYYFRGVDNAKVGHVLTEKELDAMNDIIMSVKGLNYSDWARNWSKYYNGINIYRCSDDMLFSRESEFMIFFMRGNDSNRYFISDGNLVYSVPKKHRKLFDNMLEEYIQNFLLKI